MSIKRKIFFNGYNAYPFQGEQYPVTSEQHLLFSLCCYRNPVTLAYEWITDTTAITDRPLIDRGFSGHEHLDEFHLINMNARLYDPWLGQFISPDPFVDYYPDISPYTYCFNNPLNYIDLTGMAPTKEGEVDREVTLEEVNVYSPGGGYGYSSFFNNPYFYARSSFSGGLLMSGGVNGGNGRGSSGGGGGSGGGGDITDVTETQMLDAVTVEGVRPRTYWSEQVTYYLGTSSATFSFVGDITRQSQSTFRLTNSKGKRDFRFYKNGWRGNQWVKPTKVAKVGTGIKIFGVGIGAGSIAISGYQLIQSTTIEDGVEHGLDIIIGGVGFVPVVGTGLSLFWSFGGKQLFYLSVNEGTVKQMQMGINPGLMIYQPFK